MHAQLVFIVKHKHVLALLVLFAAFPEGQNEGVVDEVPLPQKEHVGLNYGE